MADEQMHSEIVEISRQIDESGDPRQSYSLVQERIRRYRDTGKAVPEALMRLERVLADECLAESQGR